MKNLEPHIFRQRLVMEGRYTGSIDRARVKHFLISLAAKLQMTIHPDLPEPIVTSATGKSSPIHDGFEGVIFWVESGAVVYVWERFKFLTVDIYTCKPFDVSVALQFTKEFFSITESEYEEVRLS